MSPRNETPLIAEIVETHTTVSLGQLCRSCGVHAEWITLLVDEGVLAPENPAERARWTFAAHHLPRVHTAVRLERDLGLNVSGIALALELMDEIRSLRQRLDAHAER